jgi:pseudaminic acid biosynthesis-associated methylase
MEPRLMQTSQLDLWKSQFGREYTDRNDHEKPERIDAWRRLLGGIKPVRALEVGCNVGWNLEYLRRLGVHELFGVEPQSYAVTRAKARGFEVKQGTAFELPFSDASMDLVFTSGVLIHISPATIGDAIDEMYRVSKRWIVAIEYDHPTETEINYRGHEGALWKRDHGALWRTRHPDLREVRTLSLGAADGYDDCTAHLFERC